MNFLFRFIARHAGPRLERIGLAAVLNGLSQAVLLAAINYGVHAKGRSRVLLALLFLSCCAVYWLSLRSLFQQLTEVVETELRAMRLRLSRKCCQLDLDKLEQVGSTTLYEQIIESTSTISNLTPRLASMTQAVLTILFTSVYVVYHFSSALLVLLATYLIAAPIYQRRAKKSREQLHTVASQQTEFFDLAAGLLQGAKEIRLHGPRAKDAVADAHRLVDGLRVGASAVHLYNQGTYALINLTLFILLAAMVFILPSFTGVDADLLLDLTAALIFLFHPVNQVVAALPEYERGEQAIQKITALEEQLDELVPAAAASSHTAFSRFDSLCIEDLCYVHKDPAGRSAFTLGPISLSLAPGEIVFLVGGNGSGKTTLLKLLTSLYTPSEGRILVNDAPVLPAHRTAFRDLFSVVFADFHLFPKLYGLKHVSQAHVRSLLERMRLADKTELVDGQFSTLSLSTGQRKRLAMVVALLEDRPIYVFDEWTADQDPEFRRYYYEQLLPDLKGRGKAILAITHDDRYFHCADRLIALDYGSIRSVTTQGQMPPTHTDGPASPSSLPLPLPRTPSSEDRR